MGHRILPTWPMAAFMQSGGCDGENELISRVSYPWYLYIRGLRGRVRIGSVIGVGSHKMTAVLPPIRSGVSPISDAFEHSRWWRYVQDGWPGEEARSSLTTPGLQCVKSVDIRNGTSGCRDVEAKATPSRVPCSLQRSTFHLPKQSSSGFLGESFYPLFTSMFTPMTHLYPSLLLQSPVAIMHAKCSPRKPRAMKQVLAGLMLASFLM